MSNFALEGQMQAIQRVQLLDEMSKLTASP
ncbi:TPA: hypothetical protein N0F65_005246 [Lagenidium giganteum]|uniref:Uncharacterized protein n=1 Tax=Lagenidium giganteum TaxID=4803 RepID=A0AAV2Z006_9STRA|nr:TPA: hypothetical protein N0F65_005246 [Lagenidium giganteum]